MRILMTTTRGAGHFGPLRPFADALLRADHELLVAVVPAGADAVRAAGLAVWPLDEAPPEQRGAVFSRAEGVASGEEANAIVVGELFAGLDARAALPGVLAAVEEWRPDVIVSETCEFSGRLASELTGVPAVRVSLGVAAVERWAAGFAATALDELRGEWGLTPDPHGERILTGPAFTVTPLSLEDPARQGSAIRFREVRGATGDLPDFWDGDDRPLVYLSFGSVAGQLDFFPAFYRAAIEAIAPLPIRLLVTVGRDQDPTDLGALPPNVHVERWVAQEVVMPHTAALVCHGGAGTIRMALEGGVPMVLLPLFAEQPQNARAVEATGAGLVPAGIVQLPAALRAVLERPSYGEAARRIAAEIAALPPVDEAVEHLRDYFNLNARIRSSYWAASRA